ncbi:MAG: hypothetical protein JXB32_16860 [Deltaproteobacteria bacterium]|nr:hypothetical protein [Deltaproteobacteria bacterium]
MIRLTSMLHSDELRDVLERWILGRFDPADCLALKRLVNLNAYLIRRYLDDFARSLLESTLDRPVQSFPVARKGQLKDFTCRNPPVRTPRVDAMIAHYRRFPEDYYRETPFEGRVYYIGDGEGATYVLSSRSKRMRRIAEKSARRIVEYIFREIKRRADELATERAEQLGIPKDRLITPVDLQIEEFAHAERRIIKAIRTGRLVDQPQPDLAIHDVAGVKVITDFVPLDDLRRQFERDERIELLEEQRHEGRYNATNFVVRYRLDKQRFLAQPPDQRVAAILAARGVAEPGALAEVHRAFVESADDSVNVEVIAASYEEMMESEIGRAMHENRIIEQRRAQEYRGHLAKNVEYVVEYALSFALSPVREIRELPVKVWVKYMPDTFDDALKELWGISASTSIACVDGADPTSELGEAQALLSATALHE